MDIPFAPPAIPGPEYGVRARNLYTAAAVDWVVNGDREHNANLLFLSGFDPRFEEALLLLEPGDQRVLVVGNEGSCTPPSQGWLWSRGRSFLHHIHSR